ncbi:MAG: glycoside hydrolase family 3 N-terminal domain-containing protein [Thermodesulfovibrionales bacterium]|nr:glycoside hydrolase family 3 N-terminal domain-containing protein [Thermodesulfovibrionales bacterium]
MFYFNHIVSMFSNLINSFMLDSLKRKLYQLIICRLDGDKTHENSYRDRVFSLIEKGIGGFIIFGGENTKATDFIHKLQSIAEIPLFIASDIECGVGQQIKNATSFPCQMAVSAAINKNKPKDVLILENAVRAIANEAIDIGINMPLIPVMDVNQNPDNPIICTRAFSDNPKDVAWFGSQYIRILEGMGIISCAKHFPGHGDTAIDSHIALPVINKSKDDLIRIDLAPFIHSIKSGVSSIMIGHLTVPAFDSKPASLSKKIITDLLRKELGFDSLIITDALNMNALKDFGNVPAECIKAGVNVLLHPVDADMTVKELLSAIESKEISEDQIDSSLGRIMRAKKKINNIKKADVNYEAHTFISEQISNMSITLVKSSPGILPISKDKNAHILFAGDSEIYKSSLLKNYFNDELQTTNSELLVVAILTSVAAWKGNSGISDGEKQRIIELIKQAKKSIVISFGSPYVLRHFKEADMLIAAYEPSEQAQVAVIKCLIGEIGFQGKLPVKIN